MFKKDKEPSPTKETSEIPSNKTLPPSKDEFLKLIKETINSPADLFVKNVTDTITIVYVDFLIDVNILNQHVLPKLEELEEPTPKKIYDQLTIAEVDLTNQLKESVLDMLIGAVLIHIDGHSEVVVARITSVQTRSLGAPENESQVIGSQVGFNESLTTNISLVRRYIINPNLCTEKFTVGKQTNTSISLIFIKGSAAEEHVNTVRQRIEDLDIQDLIDSAALAELIDDSSKSIFPQLFLTERPDRFCDGILGGKIGIMVDGSSMAILAPYAFIEFFQSREDSNLRWPIASFVRLLRFTAIFISILLSPIYVASLTFHFEVIPQPLLIPLSESRAIVPFPPIIEALLLELIIELLREAGARLPTKVGQTIGIVGGIVIGTAAVEAGITSNILIIIVAMGALASFTTPNYMMGNVIRIVRFPIIILAGFWGYFGIALAVCILMIHLLRQSSLGAPYLSPFYPPRWRDWPNSIIRLPNPFISRQSVNARKKYKDNNEQNEKNEKKVTE